MVDVITYKDIPGINDVGPVFKGDPIFAKKNIEYFGQPIFSVAATTCELARKAVRKAKINYLKEKPILEIKDAIKKKSFVLKTKILQKGDAAKSIKDSKNRIDGELFFWWTRSFLS